jgi:plasmid stabilization system protein ParE
MKLRFSEPAETAYSAAFDYLYLRNPAAAYRFLEAVEQALDRLQTFPNLGHYIPEFPSRPYKEVQVWSHRFFYRVVGETLWVVGVWHGAQIPDEPYLPTSPPQAPGT